MVWDQSELKNHVGNGLAILRRSGGNKPVARSSAGGILEIYIFSGPIRAAGVIINNRLGFLEVYNLYMADTWM